MLELAILGFLAEGPLHGYELRRRVAQLSGWARPVSDGSLYPAINRLVKAGLLDRRAEPGTGAAQRNVLHLTEVGRQTLLERLRSPSEHEITDTSRWFTILAFLALLPDETDRRMILHRRLRFLTQPASFFYEGDRPLRADEISDPYRQGMLVVARATSRAERAWLREILGQTQPIDAPSEDSPGSPPSDPCTTKPSDQYGQRS
jgi:DNA-binding PadR family transcriptional regulator